MQETQQAVVESLRLFQVGHVSCPGDHAQFAVRQSLAEDPEIFRLNCVVLIRTDYEGTAG